MVSSGKPFRIMIPNRPPFVINLGKGQGVAITSLLSLEIIQNENDEPPLYSLLQSLYDLLHFVQYM